MADFTVVPANILPSSGSSLSIGTAGAVIAQGDVLYQDPTDSTWKLADANVASPTYKASAIAMSAATAIGQPVILLTADALFAPGFAVAAGATVILSANPGKMAPVADGVSGWYVTILGVGVGSNKVQLIFKRSDTPIP